MFGFSHVGHTLLMLRWLTFWLLQVFRTCKDNLISVLVWPSGRYLQIFYIHPYVVFVRFFRNGVSLCSYLLDKKLSKLDYLRYNCTEYVRQRRCCLDWHRNLNPTSIWKCRINFVRFLLVFDLWSTFEIFYFVDILVGFNHVSMLVNLPVNGLVWSFPYIYTQSII